MERISSKTFRFYQGRYLALMLTGDRCQGILRHQHQPLALLQDQQLEPLVCDAQDSIHGASPDCLSGFNPYGYRRLAMNSLPIAYTGEWLEPLIGGYLLGNGYRAYSTTLMRFQSPDNLSPFGEGGLNAYSYCSGDPINYTDTTGHVMKKIPALRPRVLRDRDVGSRPASSQALRETQKIQPPGITANLEPSTSSPQPSTTIVWTKEHDNAVRERVREVFGPLHNRPRAETTAKLNVVIQNFSLNYYRGEAGSHNPAPPARKASLFKRFKRWVLCGARPTSGRSEATGATQPAPTESISIRGARE